MRNPAPLSRMWFYVRIVAPAVWFVIVAAFECVAVAVVTFWSNVPERIDDIAVLWKMEAVNRGWPLSWDVQLYWFFYFLAWIMFIIGWILTSYLTVFLVHWLIF
jgi:hypothetical protein